MGLKEIIEISKPRIVVLLVITAVTSMYAASKLVGPELDSWGLIHIIIAGALASAGSSALNHYYDRDIDPLMKRTSTRPIPSGRIKPNQVLFYGLAVSVISVVYGALALNYVSAFFIALGIFFYVIIYTAWLKRLNSSNIVIGGFAGSAAAMAGWSAATGSMDILGFLVGFLVFVWTPSHIHSKSYRQHEHRQLIAGRPSKRHPYPHTQLGLSLFCKDMQYINYVHGNRGCY